MPTYEYNCPDCGHQLEKFQKISEEPLKLCPVCKNANLKRGVGGGSALLFKGSGFYINDYCKSGAQSGENNKCGCKGTHSCD